MATSETKTAGIHPQVLADLDAVMERITTGKPLDRETSRRIRERAQRITEEIRQMISDRRSVQEITRAAFKGGYRPLRYDGLNKVLLGLTTIEEIEENCSFDLAE